ncbi:expressed unknown protein [Seminavis robusta]|uniref:Uncharacterized protein n=1 Tax=Seminavis robusta TaxID=568900 RepID=A0A9N8F358_9STRA|nr:expressed unknown protein [Seminavis robusta]|eukprot:Sro4076_g352750.1 n/a (192) ;mRNA; f:145-720
MSFWNPAGRVACAATVLLPTSVVLGLAYNSRDSLGSMVLVTRPQRIALMIHALYFVYCVFAFEALIDIDPMSTTGTVPDQPDNLFWQMTCLSGEVFFVAATALALIATQPAVPRWSLLVPIAQVSYNLKNSLIWCVLYPQFSPVGQPIELMKTDAVCIALLTIVYLHHFFTAPTSASSAGTTGVGKHDKSK